MKRIWIHSASALLLAIAVLFSGIPLNAQNSRAADKDAIVALIKENDAAGMLTAEGQEILQELQLLNEMVKAAPGALTKLGAKEHREICARSSPV